LLPPYEYKGRPKVKVTVEKRETRARRGRKGERKGVLSAAKKWGYTAQKDSIAVSITFVVSAGSLLAKAAFESFKSESESDSSSRAHFQFWIHTQHEDLKWSYVKEKFILPGR